MSSLFQYIALKYLKIFLVIFIALILFYVGFDYLGATKRLPASANLRMLYVYYHAMFASDILMPLALIFSMIAVKLFLIRSNELVAFYAIGYSKAQVLRPFLVVSLLLTFVYIGAHATKYAYAEEFVRSIHDHGKLQRATTDLFFKYDKYYIYFAKLFPIAKTAEDIRIFKQQHSDIVEVIKAKKAFYREDKWYIPESTKILKKIDITFDENPVEIFEEKDIAMLEGFRPTILDHIHEGKVHYSIIDAIEAIDLLKKQEVGTDKVMSALYSMIVYPFFVPAFIVIIFFFVPISSRSLNVSFFSFVALLTTLLSWGLLFVFIRLSHSGTFSPEVGIVYPVVLIYLIAFVVWIKKAS